MWKDNIYIAAIVIDYKAASEANQQDQLLKVLRALSDKDGFHEDSSLPPFLCLDVFDPHEADGRVRHGGSGSYGTSNSARGTGQQE